MATASPLNKIERAHQMYRDGRHEEALGFYTDALSMAKTKAQKIALHSNRAACHLKLQNFKKAAEECTLVLELDQNHTGALMLRAQTLVTLKEYHSALFDVNRLMELNPSSDVYQNLQSRLKTQLLLAPIPECEEESLLSELKEDEEKEEEDEEEQQQEIGGEQTEEENEAAAAVELTLKTEVPKTIPIPQATISAPTRSEFPKTIPIPQATISAPTLTEVPKTIPIPQATISAPTRSLIDLSAIPTKGCKEIPKPKGHTRLDYSRWDRVEDDSSEEEDEDEESVPQYRFRVRTVGVRPVK